MLGKKVSDWKVFWDRLADSKNELLTADWIYVSKNKYAKRIEYIANILNLNETDILADIGCGIGLFNFYNKICIKSYIGLDFSWQLLYRGMKKKHPMKRSSYYIQGNCCYLPFKNSSITKLLSNSITQNLNEQEFKKMIIEIERVLMKGGLCFLGDINYKNKVDLTHKNRINTGIFFFLIKLLRKNKFFFVLLIRIENIHNRLRKKIVDYKRGFEIHRIEYDNYDPEDVMNWFRNINTKIECKVLEQQAQAFYPNRYDLLIRR